MKLHVGTKTINAQPMTRGEYNTLQKWLLPEGENGADEGYLVEYLDGGQSNHPEYKGYISWSPKDVFEKTYQRSGNMSFSSALVLIKQGKKMARLSWNGKGQFVVMMGPLYLPPYSTQEPGPKVNDRTAKFIGEDTPLDSQPYFALKNAQDKWQPGWVPSQGDLFADDWCIIE